MIVASGQSVSQRLASCRTPANDGPMVDRDDFEQERYLRHVGRRMKISPEALLRQLQPLGFVLTFADRSFGSNEVRYIRPTPEFPGLFDVLEIKGDVSGNHVAVYIAQDIVPHRTQTMRFVPPASYGCKNDKVFTDAVAIALETQLAQMIPGLLHEHFQREGRNLWEETANARAAAERYLAVAQPGRNLQETWQRLRSTAAEQQWQQAIEYVRRDGINSLNLVDHRTVWEIAALCQVLLWEWPERQFRGIPGGVDYKQATADDWEAHYRFHIVASRLARAPGWPIADPLVPKRCDLEETIVWRDLKPPYVAQVFDRYLSSTDRRCTCGKCLYYVRHFVHEEEPRRAEILARCNNGHEETIEFSAEGFGAFAAEPHTE